MSLVAELLRVKFRVKIRTFDFVDIFARITKMECKSAFWPRDVKGNMNVLRDIVGLTAVNRIVHIESSPIPCAQNRAIVKQTSLSRNIQFQI